MYLHPENRVKEIDRQLVKTQIFEAPGTIMLGLGLYGKFGANGNAFHPLLNDATNINILLGVGVVLTAMGGYKFLILSREKATLKRKHGL